MHIIQSYVHHSSWVDASPLKSESEILTAFLNSPITRQNVEQT